MKEKILNIVAENPGIRRRDIAGKLGVCNAEIITPVFELVREGKLVELLHRDQANFDTYYQYYVEG